MLKLGLGGVDENSLLVQKKDRCVNKKSQYSLNSMGKCPSRNPPKILLHDRRNDDICLNRMGQGWGGGNQKGHFQVR